MLVIIIIIIVVVVGVIIIILIKIYNPGRISCGRLYGFLPLFFLDIF